VNEKEGSKNNILKKIKTEAMGAAGRDRLMGRWETDCQKLGSQALSIVVA
jgi:hypothetical protein